MKTKRPIFAFLFSLLIITALTACQSDPGSLAPSSSEGEGPEDPDINDVDLPPVTDWTVHTEESYGFSVAIPPEYGLKPLTEADLNGLEPMPSAGMIILRSEFLPESPSPLVTPDLEIRVHESGSSASLAAWLSANGFEEGWREPEPFETDHVSGDILCLTTMIAPGCSYFVLGDGWVYQLIPASLEGESIIDTFKLLP